MDNVEKNPVTAGTQTTNPQLLNQKPVDILTALFWLLTVIVQWSKSVVSDYDGFTHFLKLF
jgi:hypothetical protein